MTNLNFDIDGFILNMTSQVKRLVSSDINRKTTDYIINKMDSFLRLAYEAISNDNSFKPTIYECALLLQILAEWIFHKSIDLFRAKIPFTYWDGIMQRIAFSIFEVVKSGCKKKHSQDDILSNVENNVCNTYKQALQELLDTKQISQEIFEAALSESSLDKMSNEYKSSSSDEDDIDDEFIDDDIIDKIIIATDEQNLEEMKKKEASFKYNKNLQQTQEKRKAYKLSFLNFAFWGVAIVVLICILNSKLAIINNISAHKDVIIQYGTGVIIIFALIGFITYFVVKKKIKNQLNELDNIKNQMRDLVNPNKQLERLDVDILRLEIGTGLLCTADPDQDGFLLVNMASLRQNLADELGYIIPSCRIMDSSELDSYEYRILVREQVVASGWVYPNKYMVRAEQWDSKIGDLPPENAIVAVDPVYVEQCYWLNKEDVEKHSDITAIAPEDVIQIHLKHIALKYVDLIITSCDIEKYIGKVRKAENVENLLERLQERLELEEIRKVFVNLIRENFSVKDLLFVFDKLCDYSRTTKNPHELSEKIRIDLAQQISMKYAEADSLLFAVEFDEKYTKYLEDNVKNTMDGQKFTIPKEEIQDLLSITTMHLLVARQSIGKQPVVLCSPKFRQALYNTLSKHIPTIVVLSQAEIVPEVRVEVVEILKPYDTLSLNDSEKNVDSTDY